MTAPTAVHIREILFASDFSPHSDHAFDAALALAQALRGPAPSPPRGPPPTRAGGGPRSPQRLCRAAGAAWSPRVRHRDRQSRLADREACRAGEGRPDRHGDPRPDGAGPCRPGERGRDGGASRSLSGSHHTAGRPSCGSMSPSLLRKGTAVHSDAGGSSTPVSGVRPALGGPRLRCLQVPHPGRGHLSEGTGRQGRALGRWWCPCASWTSTRRRSRCSASVWRIGRATSGRPATAP